MNTEKKIEKLVENALNSLNQIERAEPTPFFYTRLRAKMEKEQKNIWERLAAILARPVVATSTLLLILAFNAFFLFQNNDGTQTISGQSTFAQGNNSAEDYFTIAATSFDYENLEP